MSRAITARWYQRAQAEHEKALSAPQRFPLTGDGNRTNKLTAAGYTSARRASNEELAAARYLDWAKKETGQ